MWFSKQDICEGEMYPDAWIVWGSVYGYGNGKLDKNDYQGWYFCLSLLSYEWFAKGHMYWNRETWAQRVLSIRHVYLENGKRGKNGAGWQGWKWYLFWKSIP